VLTHGRVFSVIRHTANLPSHSKHPADRVCLHGRRLDLLLSFLTLRTPPPSFPPAAPPPSPRMLRRLLCTPTAHRPLCPSARRPLGPSSRPRASAIAPDRHTPASGSGSRQRHGLLWRPNLGARGQLPANARLRPCNHRAEETAAAPQRPPLQPPQLPAVRPPLRSLLPLRLGRCLRAR
jgi:hypothetical protein